jgi:hypothetical protein
MFRDFAERMARTAVADSPRILERGDKKRDDVKSPATKAGAHKSEVHKKNLRQQNEPT